MLLPGRLSASTLGDLLGVLHRGKTTGLLELTEVPGSIHGFVIGRQHRIHLFCGLVSAVETNLPVPPLGEILYDKGLLGGDALVALMRHLGRRDGRLVGEILVGERLASMTYVAAGLRAQARARLDHLFRLRDAVVTFHTARPLSAETRGAGLLGSDDFLRGRPRARDRGQGYRKPPTVEASPRSSRSEQEPDRRVSPNRPWSASSRPAPSETREAREKCEASKSARKPEPPFEEPAPYEAAPRSRVTARDAPRDKALRTLGLTDGADERAIRRAFRKLALELHPDKFATAPAEKRVRTSALFAEVSAAHHLLVA